MVIPGAQNPFHHTDRNTLRKIGEPTPNSLAAERANRTAQPGSLGIGSLRLIVPRHDGPAADAPGAGAPDYSLSPSGRSPIDP
jgi:hypothetical protein